MEGVHIGCSGWTYRDWRGPFYPDDLPQRAWLGFYARHFDTTEINASFYRLPNEATVAAWSRTAPEGFVWTWKASRYITHNKKLKDCEESVPLVFGRMSALGSRGCVLFQLPPMLRRDDGRLADFLSLLPKGRKCAFEFRHPSWYDDAVFRLLEDHDQALCISDHHHAPSPFAVTASFVYLRGHGPGGRYVGRYEEETLKTWAAAIRTWRSEAREVFCYFDNDIKSAAPFDAERLMGLLA